MIATVKPQAAAAGTGVKPRPPPVFEKTEQPMSIVFVSSEVAPWSKTGGLADVCGALPRELVKRGHRVMVVSPYYQTGKKEDVLFQGAFDTCSNKMLECFGGLHEVGYMHQVKQHKTLSFKSLAASLAAPEFLLSDFAKFDRPMQLHLGFQALHAYRAEHGSLPAPSDAAAAAELLARAKAIGQAAGGEAAECEFSDRLLRNLASGSRGELSPMCAFFGGIVGQEVMKAASGKFTPVQQWMYFDAEESLPGGGADGLPAADTAARGNRHDAQACVLGWPTQEALGKLSYLLVGAGAIGCEMLKNWAMMGVGILFVVNSLDSLTRLYTQNIGLTAEVLGTGRYIAVNWVILFALVLAFQFTPFKIEWVGLVVIGIYTAIYSLVFLRRAALRSSPT